jgi:hypothetical protein
MGSKNSKKAHKAENANANTTTTDKDAGGDAKAREKTDPRLGTQQPKEGRDGGGDVEEEEGKTGNHTHTCSYAHTLTHTHTHACTFARTHSHLHALQEC